jgi:hypothetical protein
MEASLAFQDIRNRPTELADLGLQQIDMPRDQTEFPLEIWVRVQADGLVGVVDYDSSQVGDAQLTEIGNLLQPYLQGIPEQAAAPMAASPATTPESGKKPLWRRLFG